MAAQYTAIAFLYPRPEKLDRVSLQHHLINPPPSKPTIPKLMTLSQVMEIMGELITIVKENEPDTIAYEWYKSLDHTGALRLTIIERYSRPFLVLIQGSAFFMLITGQIHWQRSIRQPLRKPKAERGFTEGSRRGPRDWGAND